MRFILGNTKYLLQNIETYVKLIDVDPLLMEKLEIETQISLLLLL